MDRRTFLRSGLAAGAAVAGGALSGCADAASDRARSASAQGPVSGFRQSVCRWPYAGLDLDELASGAREIGLASVELLEPDEWATVQRYGLTCAMANAPGDPSRRLTHGFNRIEHHEWLIPAYREQIALAAAGGVPNVICFSGNRDGLGDEEGLENCTRGIRQLMPTVEEHGVYLMMELLNSRVDHPDYQCDRTPWGVALVERVGSPRFKLLYDIYHMQIMEGDVIRTIRDNHRHIGHYHTGGVPGRNEIDESQELNYPAIMRAIAETGFDGYVGQEFIPTRDPLTSLAEAVRICSV